MGAPFGCPREVGAAVTGDWSGPPIRFQKPWAPQISRLPQKEKQGVRFGSRAKIFSLPVTQFAVGARKSTHVVGCLPLAMGVPVPMKFVSVIGCLPFALGAPEPEATCGPTDASDDGSGFLLGALGLCGCLLLITTFWLGVALGCLFARPGAPRDAPHHADEGVQACASSATTAAQCSVALADTVAQTNVSCILKETPPPVNHPLPGAHARVPPPPPPIYIAHSPKKEKKYHSIMDCGWLGSATSVIAVESCSKCWGCYAVRPRSPDASSGASAAQPVPPY